VALTPSGAAPRAAYVHVPFCRRRCGYCDFALVAGRDDLQGAYLEALGAELGRLEAPLAVDTLYLGGGTPSHLGADGVRRLFAILARRVGPVPGAEVTLEANPGDVTAGFVAAVRACGVTRVSLGAQSLAPTTLSALDRDHSPDDVRRAADLLLGAGMEVNVDVMIAAPGQTTADVEADLDAVAGLGCQHVSVYCLTLERGTAFEARRRRGDLVPVDEATERAMFLATLDRLDAAGLEHYEVSNFARPGRRCRHNETYWDHRPWEAFGPGAARFDGRTRIGNHRSPFTWMRRVLAGEDPAAEVERMSEEEAARERIVLGLRRRDGIDRDRFRAAAGMPLDALLGSVLPRWVAAGWASDDGRRVRLTREGLLLSDGLWGEVLAPAGGGTGGAGEGRPAASG